MLSTLSVLCGVRTVLLTVQKRVDIYHLPLREEGVFVSSNWQRREFFIRLFSLEHTRNYQQLQQ